VGEGGGAGWEVAEKGNERGGKGFSCVQLAKRLQISWVNMTIERTLKERWTSARLKIKVSRATPLNNPKINTQNIQGQHDLAD